MFLKPDVIKGQKIGFIGNYFTEQLFQRDFQVKILERDNCEAFVDDSQLSIVLVDTEFYNKDNSWQGLSLIELITYLETLDLVVVLVSYNDKIINPNYYHIFISENPEAYENTDEKIHLPYLINEYIFNPINLKKSKHIAILSDTEKFEEFESVLDNQLIKYLEKEINNIECLNVENLSKPNLLKVSRIIKKCKVVYIDNPESFSNVILKYIQLICAAQQTALIYKSKTSKNSYIISEDNYVNIINLLKSFNNESILNDHNILRTSRRVFLNNSLMRYNQLPSILNGDGFISKDIKISVVTSTIRKNNISNLIEQMNKQNYVDIEIILLTHGFRMNEDDILKVKEQSKFPVKILNEERKVVYGACLNKCIENMSYDYFAKIDDDDLYFPNYLIDSWIAYQYSEASIVGKHSSFWYFENQGMTSIRFEKQAYKFTKYIAGATLFTSKKTIDEFKFSPLASGIDSDLLKRISEKKKLIYCNGPYEFSVFRDIDSSSHTWKVDELYLLRSSKILFYGTSLKDSLSIENNF